MTVALPRVTWSGGAVTLDFGHPIDHPYAFAHIEQEQARVPGTGESDSWTDALFQRAKFSLRWIPASGTHQNAGWHSPNSGVYAWAQHQRQQKDNFAFLADRNDVTPHTCRLISWEESKEDGGYCYRVDLEVEDVDGRQFDDLQPLPPPGPRPYEWWRSGVGYFSDQAGTTPATPLGAFRCWTGSLQGWKAIWDNAIAGGTNPVLNAAGNGITMVGTSLQNLEYRHRVDGNDTVLPLFAGVGQPFSVIMRLTTGVMSSPNDFFDMREIGIVAGLPIHDFGADSTPAWRTSRADDDNVNASLSSTTNPPANGSTYTVTYVFDGTAVRMYVNGALVLSGTLNVGQCSFNWLFLGGNPTAAHTGDFLHAMIFDHAISAGTQADWEAIAGAVP